MRYRFKTLAAPPLMPVAEKSAVGMFGPTAAQFVTIMLCISIAGAVSAMIWTGPRVYYAMARDGFLPGFFSDTEHHHGTPVRSIVLQSLWVTVLVLSGSFEQLVIYSGMVITAFTALTVGAVIILRQQASATRSSLSGSLLSCVARVLYPGCRSDHAFSQCGKTG